MIYFELRIQLANVAKSPGDDSVFFPKSAGSAIT